MLLGYHYVVALFAALYYGFPSRHMVVIGVTGTKGKTSTANFIWSVLHAADMKAGLLSTVNIKIHDREMLNPFHMTMPGRFRIQKFLYEMKRRGITHSVIETTSEGIKQSRHSGIAYDIAVFTNLSPEHLQSHGGSFDQYRETKGRLFAGLPRGKRKVIGGKTIDKVIIANSDDAHAEYFLSFYSDKKITYGRDEHSDFRASHIREGSGGVSFTVKGVEYALHTLGEFNVFNALPAIAVASLCNIPIQKIQLGFASLATIPGRMEVIDEGQDFTVIVDYAHEAVSMNAALQTARGITAKGARVIVLLGAEGGGRDVSKRASLGSISALHADMVIVSNVDPYDDDPKKIISDIADAARNNGKVIESNLFLIEDRREGIKKALSLAKPGDTVLITGKGAEQSMIIGSKCIPWDDRSVTREELTHSTH